jgi:dTDP-4-amino-4,6-dideoxygalactose transaminase
MSQRRGAFRLVPPAGAPVPVRTVLRSALCLTAEGVVDEALRSHVGSRPAFFVSSGRAALTLLLKAMQRGSQRSEVVIPAYTCFSVPSAVARSGLTIRLCDVDPKTLDLDLNALAGIDLARVLCIVPSGLYGLPGDLTALETIARTAGTSLIDDAAQCLGASQDGRPCGTFGEAGFYSLGRGKGITTMGGGILVTRHDDLSGTIEKELSPLPQPTSRQVIAAVAGSLIYAAMLAPSRYWLVDRMPFLDLGASHFEPEFPIARLSAYQRRLGAQLLALVGSYNTIRRRHAERLRSGIDGIEGIEIPRAAPGADPVYLRFPLLARDAAHRSDLLAALRAAGIAASASYPTAVGDIPGIARYLAPDQESCSGARSIATRIITLPTHPGVAPEDTERMVAAVRRAS